MNRVVLFSIWLILFSVFLIVVEYVPFNIYNVLYYGSYLLLPILLIRINTSNVKKSLISAGVGLWMWGLMFIYQLLEKILPNTFGNTIEPPIAFCAGFFFLWCLVIAGIFLFIWFFQKYLLPKLKKSNA